MTDPAPPARTMLSPKERVLAAEQACLGMADPFSHMVHACERHIADQIRAAETLARAEGRIAGLEEAAEIFAKMPIGPRGGEYHLKASSIVTSIRLLIEDALKAPEDPEKSAPRVPR